MEARTEALGSGAPARKLHVETTGIVIDPETDFYTLTSNVHAASRVAQIHPDARARRQVHMTLQDGSRRLGRA